MPRKPRSPPEFTVSLMSITTSVDPSGFTAFSTPSCSATNICPPGAQTAAVGRVRPSTIGSSWNPVGYVAAFAGAAAMAASAIEITRDAAVRVTGASRERLGIIAQFLEVHPR